MKPRESTATDKAWRDQVKAYITALAWNPARLTGEQLDSVQNFARSLPPIKCQVTNIRTKHRPEDYEKVIRQICVLVKDTAEKLQATNDCLHAKHPEDTPADEDSNIINKFV